MRSECERCGEPSDERAGGELVEYFLPSVSLTDVGTFGSYTALHERCRPVDARRVS